MYVLWYVLAALLCGSMFFLVGGLMLLYSFLKEVGSNVPD